MLLVLHSLPTHAILYTWATLSTSPTDISLSTGVTLIIAVTLVTDAILFTWATLSMTPTDISLSTGAIGVTLATETLLSPGLRATEVTGAVLVHIYSHTKLRQFSIINII